MSWTDKDLHDLRDLRDAFDAMKDKKLITLVYISHDGGCCGNGALAIWRGTTAKDMNKCVTEDDITNLIGISTKLHHAIAGANDMSFGKETQEERYIRMRKWVDEQLGETA